MTILPQLIAAMMIVESGGDAGAIGDGGRALGVLQIHAGVVADVNRRHGTNFKHTDALDVDKAVRICRLYLEMYVPRGSTPDIYARTWNGGPNGACWESTLAYWKKVEAKYNEIVAAHKNLYRQ